MSLIRLLLHSCILLCLLATPVRIALAQSATATPAATPAPAPETIPLSEIAPQVQSALSTLKSLETEETADDTVSAVRDSLPELSARLSQLLAQGSKVTRERSSLEDVRQLETGWQKFQASLDQAGTALAQRGQVLEKELEQVRQTEAPWQATRKAFKSDAIKAELAPPEATRQLVDEVIRAAADAGKHVKLRQTAVLDVQARLGNLSERARAGLATVQQASSAAVKNLLVRDSSPIWAPESQPRPDVLSRWRTSLAEQWSEVPLFATSHREPFIIHGVFFALLLGTLFWLRRRVQVWTAEQPRLQKAAPIIEVPMSTALGVSFLLIVESSLYAAAPALLRSIATAVVLPFFIVLLRRLLGPRIHGLLYTLAGFFLADQVRLATTSSLPATSRWLFCGELLAAIVVFGLILRGRRSTAPAERIRPGFWVGWGARLAIFVLIAAFSAVVLGYVRLGTLLGHAVLGSSYWALFIYALLRVLSGFSLIALCVGPLSRTRVAQEHRDTVQEKLYEFLRFLAGAFWLWKTLLLFQVQEAAYRTTAQVLSAPLFGAGWSITLGSILSFLLALWLAVQVSRLVRFFLEEEAYPHLKLSPGLPYAISTMVNYGILLVGLLVALALLGVDLTKVTIVAGAFSVGLGFGLQNIINNFVSGIIILFERPVKIGDMVQVGDSIGEVRRIGIRASIIRTREGSDIIVPNGNFISNQVTNWTYSDRRRSIEIPISIAAGHDPQEVLHLLQQTAAAIPSTEDHPDPQVYITAITASTISYSVRAWTGRFEDSLQARSDLSVSLAKALSSAGIKMV